MNPKAEEFIRDIRRAERLKGKPVVTSGSQLIDPHSVAHVMERARTIWLTPKVVEGYDPSAFEEWPEILQSVLREAVEDFREALSSVPEGQPVTASAGWDGVQAFGELKIAVRNVVLWEWCRSARDLTDRCETWAGEIGWVTRRQGKELHEVMLGEYKLDQLYMYAEGNLYILDPLARFIPGGLGAFDLSIQPSFFTTSIYRHSDGLWHIHLDVGQGVRDTTGEPISADALKRAVTELRSLL